MSYKINANVSEIRKKATRIERSLHDELVPQINKLYSDGINRLCVGWRSDENREYIDKFTDYLEDLKKLGNAISDYTAFLKMAADMYEKALEESCNKTKCNE